MTESIRVFENSLRDYLINVQTDAYNTQTKIQHRYNNLKVYMEPKKYLCRIFGYQLIFLPSVIKLILLKKFMEVWGMMKDLLLCGQVVLI